LYHAKASAAASAAASTGDPATAGRAKVPGWVDRWLVFAWMPLYFVYLGPAQRDLLVNHAKSINDYMLPMVDGLTRLQPYLIGPAIAFAVAAVAVFVWHERRAFGLRNWPRLSAAAGITLLSVSFLLFNPVKVYMAFAFSHAVEYMVFVWAFQRRRYSAPARQSPLARWVRRPWAFYPALLLLFGGGYLLLNYWGKYFLPGHEPLVVAGTPVVRWLFFWGIYQSLMHFDYDGVLWQMRQPQVRGNI
jgi:putative flippase GtrA